MRSFRRMEKRSREGRRQGPRATTTSARAHDSAGRTPAAAIASALGGALQGSCTDTICTSKMARTNDQRPWSDLPSELLCHVLGCLPAHADRVRFAAVCDHWCISARQPGIPPPLPWHVLSDGTFFTLPCREPFQINGAGFDSCSGAWLVFSKERAGSLVNPLTKATLKLPDRYCINRIDEPRRVINGHWIPNTVLNTHAGILIWKLVVCSEVLVAAIVRGGGLWTLAFCSPGANLWYVSALGKISLPSDIMFYDGKLYTVDTGGKLYSIIVKEDINSGKLSLSRIERLISKTPFFLWPSSCYGRAMRQYLVESCGALLLVRRRNFRQPPGSDVYASRSKVVRIEFEVFKANFQSSQWVNVSSVGDDQVLFVGVNSQSASVSQYREKGNCIFFFLHDSGGCSSGDAPRSYSIYDMSDRTIHSPLPTGSCRREKLASTWLFP